MTLDDDYVSMTLCVSTAFYTCIALVNLLLSAFRFVAIIESILSRQFTTNSYIRADEASWWQSIFTLQLDRDLKQNDRSAICRVWPRLCKTDPTTSQYVPADWLTDKLFCSCKNTQNTVVHKTDVVLESNMWRKKWNFRLPVKLRRISSMTICLYFVL